MSQSRVQEFCPSGRGALACSGGRTNGLTLLEMLISLAIISIVVGAIGRALTAGFDFERHSEAVRIEEEPRRLLQDRISSLLRQAFVSSDQNDAATYFIGIVSGGNTSDGADALVFTRRGERLSGSVLASQDDFETNNSRLGPQGGVEEVSLALTSIAGVTGESGLFFREQRPADGDPTQGGYESVLEPTVTEIRFQFFDGTQWVPEWDTDQTNRRIPSAVLVSYSLDGKQQPSFVVRLPLSDVTPANPVVVGEGTG